MNAASEKMSKYLVAAFGDGGYSTVVEGIDEAVNELREMMTGERKPSDEEWVEETLREAREDLTDGREGPVHWSVDFEDGKLEVITITHLAALANDSTRKALEDMNSILQDSVMVEVNEAKRLNDALGEIVRVSGNSEANAEAMSRIARAALASTGEKK